MGVVIGELKMMVEGGEREELQLWHEEDETTQHAVQGLRLVLGTKEEKSKAEGFRALGLRDERRQLT